MYQVCYFVDCVCKSDKSNKINILNLNMIFYLFVYKKKPTMYEATPLEQAYSIYVAQQVFSNDYTSSSMSIRISGRDAVPFLTRSGVDRSVLKTIWNVIDPVNIGSVTAIQQFWVLFRLISLAQAGVLQIHHSSSDMNALLSLIHI